jgi:hypothetical protein
MSGKMLLDSRTKDEKASPECWRGEGFLSLCQRARGETKKSGLGIKHVIFSRPGGVVLWLCTSPPATEEIGAMGREIESPQGIGYW